MDLQKQLMEQKMKVDFNTWELIDGVQRVSTILCFAGTDEEREKIGTPNLNELTLEQLKKLVNIFEIIEIISPLKNMHKSIKILLKKI